MPSEVAFCEALRKTIARIDHGDRQFLNRYRLTAPRYYALKCVYENPGVSLTSLSASMLIDKSSATRLVRTIEAEGLVRRLRSESDRRTHRLYLSAAGKRLFQSASAAHNRYARERFSDLDIDVEALVNDLQVVIHSLEREAERVE